VRLDRDETYGDLEPKRGAGVRAWITVQRGCDKFCTYCVVPYSRGRERSLALDEILAQTRRAVAHGYREVVFLGQTVNSYHDGRADFADLLRAASDIEGLLRIRYTSPHPSDMSERVVRAMADCPKVCPHVHLPLQSGSDRILRAMNRSYTIDRYGQVLSGLRAAVPGLAVSTDIIVGFPGETEEDFEATASYLEKTRYDGAFLFKYSARSDTKAYRWPETVNEEEKGRRLARLIDLQQRISGERNAAWVGREVEVLVEGRGRRDTEQLFGKSAEFKDVVFPDDGTAVGALRRVRVIGATTQTLVAGPVGPRAASDLTHVA
jgi:tRNA-2-methylthio-N6-dimethylallyladenosine synthase